MRMCIELANKSTQIPRGIMENVIVKIDMFVFLVDFVVLDMKKDHKIPIILGRPFLATSHAMIDVFNNKISFEVGYETNTFDIEKSMRFPPSDDDTCHSVDMIDLSILDHDLINQILGNLEPESKGYTNPALFAANMFEGEKPTTKLKDFPSHLEYALLGNNQEFHVIILSFYLPKKKNYFLEFLKNIRMLWHGRLNPKVQDIVNAEIVKLLDAGLIYAIFDSPWVSPIHVVPKKGGITLVTNKDNELVPTRTVTGWRVYLDYRKLNDATRKYHFPLPFIDQMLERLTSDLNARLQEKVLVITAIKENSRKLKGKDVVDEAVMLKVDVPPLAPKLWNNRTVHSDYIRHTQEETVTLREIVEQGRTLNPLNNSLDYAYKYTKRIQELLILIRQICPCINNLGDMLMVVTPMNKTKKVRLTEPITCSGNTTIKTSSSSNVVFNKPMLSSTGVNLPTSVSGSQPSGNTTKDKIQQTPSSTKKNKLEAHSRIVRSSLRNKKCVVNTKDTASVQNSKLNVNSDLQCVACNGCLFSDNHDSCVLEFINTVNARVKSKTIKKALKIKVWKPTGNITPRVFGSLTSSINSQCTFCILRVYFKS
nr:putative reverse transcriptase domain-containing protein [Tanacetum cinerariifolium]